MDLHLNVNGNVTITIDLSEKFMGVLQLLLPPKSDPPVNEKSDSPVSEKSDSSADEKKFEATKNTDTTKNPAIEIVTDSNKSEDTKKEETKTEPSAIEFSTLRNEFAKRLKAGKTAELQAILNQFGVSKLSELERIHHAEAYALVLEV